MDDFEKQVMVIDHLAASFRVKASCLSLGFSVPSPMGQTRPGSGLPRIRKGFLRVHSQTAPKATPLDSQVDPFWCDKSLRLSQAVALLLGHLAGAGGTGARPDASLGAKENEQLGGSSFFWSRYPCFVGFEGTPKRTNKNNLQGPPQKTGCNVRGFQEPRDAEIRRYFCLKGRVRFRCFAKNDRCGLCRCAPRWAG